MSPLLEPGWAGDWFDLQGRTGGARGFIGLAGKALELGLVPLGLPAPGGGGEPLAT